MQPAACEGRGLTALLDGCLVRCRDGRRPQRAITARASPGGTKEKRTTLLARRAGLEVRQRGSNIGPRQAIGIDNIL